MNTFTINLEGNTITMTFIAEQLSPLFYTLLIVMLIDIVTGVGKAVVLKNLNSSVSTNGFIRKLGIILLVIFAQVLEPVVGNDIDLSALACSGFILSEGLSVLENFTAMGVPVPSFLRDRLDKQRLPPPEPPPTPPKE